MDVHCGKIREFEYSKMMVFTYDFFLCLRVLKQQDQIHQHFQHATLDFSRHFNFSEETFPNLKYPSEVAPNFEINLS